MSLGVALATLVTAGAGAQRDGDALKAHLVEMMTEPKNVAIPRVKQWSVFNAAQFDSLVTRGDAAKARKLFRVAADDFALASVVAPGIPLRDTARLRLHAVMRQVAADRGKASAARVDAMVDQALDEAFQQAFDHQVPITRAAPSTSGRLVLAEYITGTQCSTCWLHDRAYAILLQRYAPTDVIVLGYHDSPGYPIVPSDGDDLWAAISSAGQNPPMGFYNGIPAEGHENLGWVDGTHLSPNSDSLEKAASIPAATYSMLAEAIERRRSQPPGAQIAMTLTPSGVSDTGLAAVRVDLRVTPSEHRKRLGVRLVLVEDTVRVTGFTNRRVQYMTVRKVAWFGSPGSLIAPLPAEGTAPTTLSYTFDVAKLQRQLLATPAADEEARIAFPDLATWRMQPRRLGVVAIIQDQDTKEVLQTAYQYVLLGGASRR